MKILFTGASSFSGMAYANELAQRGHEVVCTFSRPGADAYDALSQTRIFSLAPLIRKVWEAPMGSARMLEVAGQPGMEAACLHGANVGNYKSPVYSIFDGLKTNTEGVPALAEKLAKAGCRAVVMTGTYFEADEGTGSAPMGAFSPYAVAKTLSYDYMRFYFARAGMSTGKFVMPNPFGPLEKEASFTNYLNACWFSGKAADVRTPDYVRDNAHISFLALAYAEFTEKTSTAEKAALRLNPGGYAETQKEFTLRYARELGKRLGIATPVTFAEAPVYTEPMQRHNTCFYPAIAPGWDESSAWDSVAAAALKRHHGNRN